MDCYPNIKALTHDKTQTKQNKTKPSAQRRWALLKIARVLQELLNFPLKL